MPYQGVYDKLSAELAAGTSNYDVATIDVIWMAKFADFAEPLDSLFTDAVKKDLAPALLADAQVNGKWVGMPEWANAEILFYRKDLFSDPKQQAAFKAQYGYDLVPPTNWKQSEDAAKFFTQDTNNDNKPDLYGTDVIGVNPEEWMAEVLQAGSPGVVLDDTGNVIIDNDAHLKALQYYTDISSAPAIRASAPSNSPTSASTVCISRRAPGARPRIPTATARPASISPAPMTRSVSREWAWCIWSTASFRIMPTPPASTTTSWPSAAVALNCGAWGRRRGSPTT